MRIIVLNFQTLAINIKDFIHFHYKILVVCKFELQKYKKKIVPVYFKYFFIKMNTGEYNTMK